MVKMNWAVTPPVCRLAGHPPADGTAGGCRLPTSLRGVPDALPDRPPLPGSAPAPAELRASDAEREAIVEALSAACAEGRLTLAELSSRVGAAYAAVSRGEL